ncbi:hypothetical protein D3C73_1317820 [compost metagenome]
MFITVIDNIIFFSLFVISVFLLIRLLLKRDAKTKFNGTITVSLIIIKYILIMNIVTLTTTEYISGFLYLETFINLLLIHNLSLYLKRH